MFVCGCEFGGNFENRSSVENGSQERGIGRDELRKEISHSPLRDDPIPVSELETGDFRLSPVSLTQGWGTANKSRGDVGLLSI